MASVRSATTDINVRCAPPAPTVKLFFGEDD